MEETQGVQNAYLISENKTNSLNIIQPEEVEFHHPTTINCSFTVQEKRIILRTEVYWMIGDPRESYIYHPNPDYIHPDYRGKTRLVDGSNLLLEDFHGPDNTTFYCRVIIRRCLATERHPGLTVTILEDGAGTHLLVKGNTWYHAKILAVYVGLKAFLSLLLLIAAMMSRVLVLLMLCLWVRLHETSGHVCVDQPARTESIEGTSVTIPCQFSFPETKNSIESATFIVRASDENFCRGDDKIIYNSSIVFFSPKYQGRLNVTFDLRHRNASITINNVMQEDATQYCCRIELSFLDGKKRQWQTPDGTRLTVKDRNEPGLETIPLIFAAPGENVTLLGHFTSDNLTSASDVTCHVKRTADRGTGCDRGINIGECTYKNNALYFQINQVTSEDNAFYCYQVKMSTNNEEKNTYYYLGPQLLIIGG
ncbi:uncharacterized protein LOC120930591 [Rana temporaria]|uniref:uncharacterized protein LOC120930591 n=1 Tax=Rana temporaria TaxID=8407 RepID=UPI001AACF21B|nr:uncharacterized protein LOC120930591 [Rana temporaria]